MPTFRFAVTRDVTETVFVEVDAPGLQAAQHSALTDVDRYAEKDNCGLVDWSLDDPPTSPEIYLPAPDDFEIVRE